MSVLPFSDRRAAGRLLAQRLLPMAAERPLVIALPRGGVPVAFEVARALGAPLDVLAVRKLGAPMNPEFAVGALAEDGTAVLDPRSARSVGMTQAQLDATVEREVRELRRRVEDYRDGRAALDVRGHTVIVVDDGLATGLTDLAAVRALRARGAERIVVAAPVGSPPAVSLIGQDADEVVCYTVPPDLDGVGRWYRDFSPVEDSEVLELLRAAAGEAPGEQAQPAERELRLALDGVELAGDLTLPSEPRGLVIFAHGSGSSRRSPRNRAVAATLNRAGFATLLFDLLTEDEAQRRELVFDIPLLAHRLAHVTRWASEDPGTGGLAIGYFGASTGAGAALSAAADVGRLVRAVVSRGGRPDLAAEHLPQVSAPTLLIVGSRDQQVLELNRQAAALLRCPHQLAVVAGATHLFEEPGTLEQVADLAIDWFEAHLSAPAQPRAVAEGQG
jgi:putative phosphoribosyl transferase